MGTYVSPLISNLSPSSPIILTHSIAFLHLFIPVFGPRFSFSRAPTSWETTSHSRMTRLLFPPPSSPSPAVSTAAGEDVKELRLRGAEGGVGGGAGPTALKCLTQFESRGCRNSLSSK